MGTLSVRVGSCLPPAFLPGFPGRLTRPFQACSHGATVSETTQSGPQHLPHFCYGGTTKGTGAAVINRVMLGRAGFKGQNVHFSQARFAPGSHSFQYKAEAASGIFSRLSQAGEAKQSRD